MELPLWVESVWNCNRGLRRRTRGMDGWWMGKRERISAGEKGRKINRRKEERQIGFRA
jgi:hypothetical protein